MQISTFIIIHFVWLLFIIACVHDDYRQIKSKITPNHKRQWFTRAGYGIFFWLLGIPLVRIGLIQPDSWLALPIWQAFSFMLFFNSGLNLARKLPVWNLGETGGSVIDRWCYDHLGELPTFVFLVLLYGASVETVIVGLYAVIGR